MSIRIRWPNGPNEAPIALCAAEFEAEWGDLYLGDPIHEALTDKFMADWTNNGIIPVRTAEGDDDGN